MGAGSNTLFRDLCFNGTIIKLGKSFNYINLLDNNKIEVGSATLDKKISDFALENSISGFEFLSCIPGSIGGSVTMNSGCYGFDVSKIFFSLKAMSLSGEIKNFNKDQINFFYRGNNFNKEFIILSVVLQGMRGRKSEKSRKRIKFVNQKKITQPSKNLRKYL